MSNTAPQVKPVGNGFLILPPAPGLCPICATKHEAELPHNQQSLYYQMTFHGEHKRYPTWVDAAMHCTDDVRQFWFDELRRRKVKIGDEAAVQGATA